MADVVLYGMAFSSYVRTARLALAEKGVDYVLEPVELGSEAHGALHPFRKMPAFRHGPVHLFETFAITRYVDEAFAGPPLQPADAADRAVMTQWIGAISDYGYTALVRDYLLIYLFATMRGTEPDRSAIDAAVPKMQATLSTFERLLPPGSPTLVGGDTPTLADFFLLPIIHYLRRTPESASHLASLPGLSAWFDGIAARQSAIDTLPPPPPGPKG